MQSQLQQESDNFIRGRMGKVKTICDWSKKRLERDAELLREITSQPDFFCRKCGRVAKEKRYLCKGIAFDKVLGESKAQAATSGSSSETKRPSDET
ncbi:MAG: hypothetical protein AAF226_00680 [Verrucomicrobiota bacterium]